MEITWLGQACFRLKGKNATAILDPYFEDFVGLKLPKDLNCDVVLRSHTHEDHSNLEAIPETALKVIGPGEYEIKGLSITGVETYHDDKLGEERGQNTVYNITLDGINIVHLGDLGHKLTEEQIQEIGVTDILLVPVGGTYTIGPELASEVASQLEPSIIIPMHYAIPGLKFELAPLEAFLKEMGVENLEVQPKLTITKDKLPEETQVVVLQKA